MSAFYDTIYDWFGTIENRKENKISTLWRAADDSDNYRVSLIAHEEAVLNAALAAPNNSEEREKYIKHYRFLRNYRAATDSSMPVSKDGLKSFRDQYIVGLPAGLVRNFDNQFMKVVEFRDQLSKVL